MGLFDDGWSWDNGEVTVGGVTIDTGLGVAPEETDEAEVIYLNSTPATPFPWEWVAAAGLILGVFYLARR